VFRYLTESFMYSINYQSLIIMKQLFNCSGILPNTVTLAEQELDPRSFTSFNVYLPLSLRSENGISNVTVLLDTVISTRGLDLISVPSILHFAVGFGAASIGIDQLILWPTFTVRSGIAEPSITGASARKKNG